jgi:hypothetical protein
MESCSKDCVLIALEILGCFLCDYPASETDSLVRIVDVDCFPVKDCERARRDWERARRDW